VLWLTGVLGWTEPGFTIVLLTVIIGFACASIVVGLMVLPHWLAEKHRSSSGVAAFVFGLLTIIFGVVALVIHTYLAVFIFFALLSLVSRFAKSLK